MRAGHGGAVEVSVAAAGNRGAHVDARRADVWLVQTGREVARAAAAKAGNNVVDVRGPAGGNVAVVARRANRAGSRAGVAGRKRRENAGRPPGVYRSLIPRVAAAAAPGVVDNIRAHVGVARRVARGYPQGAGRGNPFRRGKQGKVGATAGFASFSRNPGGPRSHTNLVGAAVIPHHRAHGVCAVIVIVARRAGGADVRGIIPVEVMVETAAQIAAILVHHGRMGVVHAGVHVSHDHAFTGATKGCPDFGGAHAVNAPFNRRQAFWGQAHKLVGYLIRLGRRQPGHVGPGGNGVKDVQIRGDEYDVGNKESAITLDSPPGRLRIQISNQASLAGLGCLAQRVIDVLPARSPIAHVVSRAQVCFFCQIDPIGAAAGIGNAFTQPRFQLRSRGAGGGSIAEQEHQPQHRQAEKGNKSYFRHSFPPYGTCLALSSAAALATLPRAVAAASAGYGILALCRQITWRDARRFKMVRLKQWQNGVDLHLLRE